ncbi:MAG: ribose transport system substrate-binding protein [Mariniblastus sp.]|jgi:ribose transport system substrate-binding protein
MVLFEYKLSQPLFYSAFSKKVVVMIRNVCLIIIAAASLSLGGCSSKRQQAEPYDGPPLTVAFVPRLSSVGESPSYWQLVRAGAEQAADELGNVEVLWRPPAGTESEFQVDVLNELGELEMDGVILAPRRKDDLVRAVERTIEGGTPVVVCEGGIDPGPAVSGFVSSDNLNRGKLAAEATAELLGEQGNVILLLHVVGNELTRQREEGFLKEIKGYSKIEVVSSDQRGGETVESAEQKVGELLQIFGGELDAICVVSAINAEGALKAIQSAGLSEQVQLISLDRSDAMALALASGSCAAVVLPDPFDLGYQSVLMMVNSIVGRDYETPVSTESIVATAENLDETRVDALLFPAGE